jgi:hypothetical protein
VFLGKVVVERQFQGRTVETIQLRANDAVRIGVASAPVTRLNANPGRFVSRIPRGQPNSLLAWYRFDQIIDGLVLRTPDSSGHGRSLTLQEMTRANLVPGKSGSALAFNISPNAVNQRVSLPWSPAFDLVGKSFTLALWLNRRAAGPEIHEIILQKEGESASLTGGYSILRERDSGRLVFRARSAADKVCNIATDTSGDDAPEGVWVHFAVVAKFDAASGSYDVVLYRNGMRAGRRDGVELASVALPLNIGGLENGWAFRGLLDDVQVYARSLADVEIRHLAAHPGDVAPAERSIDQERR